MKLIEDKATKLLIEYIPEQSKLDLLKEELQAKVITIDPFIFRQAFSDAIELAELGHNTTQFIQFIGDTWAVETHQFYPPIVKLSKYGRKGRLEVVFVVSMDDFPK